jgi:hypothetical protein
MAQLTCRIILQGSLKFLLQAASALAAAFEKIVKVLGEIGLILPSFKQYAALFPSNDGIRRALCLFFEDMLNFYAVLLNFVTTNSTTALCVFIIALEALLTGSLALSVILEPFWPRIRAKIDKIRENIEDHKTLLTVNVTLEDISRAQRARKRDQEEYDRAANFRDHQTFSTIRDHVRPENYDEGLVGILQETSKGSGTWLDKQDNFMGWLNPVDRTVRCLWLNGIPGAGMFKFPPRPIVRWLTGGRQNLLDRKRHRTVAEKWELCSFCFHLARPAVCREDARRPQIAAISGARGTPISAIIAP